MVGKDMVVQNFGSLVGSFKNSAVQKQSNVSGDFNKTMSDVQENQSKASDRQVKGKSVVDVSKGMKKLTDSEKPVVDKEDCLQLKDTENESVESENAVVLMSGQVLTPQLLEQGLGELEEKIAELVTDIMGVTEEELMDMLEESGMQLVDLLNPENLKEFVLNANGCEDATQLLTNETAATQLSQLLEGLKELELDEDLGITKEELTEILEKHLDDSEKPVTKEEDKALVEDEATESANIKIVVEKETNTKSANDFSKEEGFSKEGQDAPKDNPVDTFVQNLAATQTEGTSQPSVEQVQVMREIVNQVIEQIKIAIKPESTSMELQLNPESLGRVDLTVASKNGVLTASFTAENQIAKEAIESQIQVLKDNLNNQGLKVEAIEVNVSQFGFRQNTESGADAQGQQGQQKKTGTRRINLERFTEEAADVSEEEALAARVLRDNGGTVDYTA